LPRVRAAAVSDARIARLAVPGQPSISECCRSQRCWPGISRSGITMAGGLWARPGSRGTPPGFAFLLATPVILAAGVLKIPSLAGTAGAQHPWPGPARRYRQPASPPYLSVRFLVRWFNTRTLTPFAIYCLAFGTLSLAPVRILNRRRSAGQPVRADRRRGRGSHPASAPMACQGRPGCPSRHTLPRMAGGLFQRAPG